MKTKHFFFLTMVSAFLIINACKKDDDPEPSPSADFTISKDTAVVDEELQFTNSSSNATSFVWSFGDGNSSTEASPKKAYATSNLFVVTLSATGSGGTEIFTRNVRILPYNAFTVLDETNLTNNVPVQFSNDSKGATSYEWSFGDPANSTSTQEDATFTYAAGGTYTVTLKANGAGGQSVSTKTITVDQTAATKELFFIEYGNSLIRKLALDGSGATANVLDITGFGGAGIAYDQANDKVYFSDFEVVPEGKIWRMNSDGSGLVAIVTGLTDPYGVALDTDAGKVYWVDDLGNVSRANLDGTSQEIGIVNIVDGQLRAIALDLDNDKMYFYEVNLENLYMANLDGSNPVAIVSGVYGYGILVDAVNDKLYFEDQNSATLIRANLDGTGQQVIDANGTRMYGMAIDYTDNKLYWSGRDSGQLNRANLDGSSPEILLMDLVSPRGIFIKQ